MTKLIDYQLADWVTGCGKPTQERATVISVLQLLGRLHRGIPERKSYIGESVGKLNFETPLYIFIFCGNEDQVAAIPRDSMQIFRALLRPVHPNHRLTIQTPTQEK